MENFCTSIVKRLLHLSNTFCTKDELEVYVYGLSTFLYSIIPSAILLFSALIMQNMSEMIFWIFSFLSLRKHAGGIHAKTIRKCFIYSILLGLSTYVICPLFNATTSLLYFAYIFIALLLLVILAPVTQKKFSQKQRYLCKIKILIIIPILSAIAVSIPNLNNYFIHALSCTIFLCLAEKIKKC